MSFEIYSFSKKAAHQKQNIRRVLIGVAVVIFLFSAVYLFIILQNYRGINAGAEIKLDLAPSKKEIGDLKKEMEVLTHGELEMGKTTFFRYKGHFFLRMRVMVAEGPQLKSRYDYRRRIEEVLKKTLPGCNAMVAVSRGKKKLFRFLIIGEEISPEDLKKEVQQFKKPGPG